MSEELVDRRYGAVTVLFGASTGKYPHGNTLWVEGADTALLIDPSLGLVARKKRPHADLILNSHCHEDHIAGNDLYPETPLWLHEADAPQIRSLDAMMEIYGFSPPVGKAFRARIESQFRFLARPDARPFADGHVFDLGGGVRVRVLHTPGHTRGHCAFHIEPDDMVFLADIDLSGFGPYYGDAWSDLEDFERTLTALRELECRYYATFHHIGVLEGRAAYLERFDRFHAMIADRERRMLAYLAEPHTLEEVAAHGFVYRPGAPDAFKVDVERRSMGQHIERLLRDGALAEVEPGRFQVAV